MTFIYWVNVDENVVVVTGTDVIVRNNINAVKVKFSFSEEWDDLTKNVVFRGSGKTIGIELSSDLVTIPWECCKTVNDQIYVGAYGVDSNGSVLRPTIWSLLGRIVDGVNVSGVLSPSPSDSILGTVIEALGDLKDDIDAAMNRVDEISENLSDVETDFETYSEHPNLYGRNEPDQHPIEAITGLQDALVTHSYLTPEELKELIRGDGNE